MRCMGRRSDFTKRGHEVFLTLIDEIAFARALTEAFPATEFWDVGFLDRKLVNRRIPTLHLGETLHVEARLTRPGWKVETAEWDEEGYLKFGPEKTIWIMRSIWDWTLHRGEWAFDPPLLKDGYISTSYRKDDGWARDVMETMWRRILPCVALYFRNRAWVGHDALRWAGEAPRRMIAGHLRPLEGWSFEKLPPAKRKYYEGLEAMRPESDPQPPPETLE